MTKGRRKIFKKNSRVVTLICYSKLRKIPFKMDDLRN